MSDHEIGSDDAMGDYFRRRHARGGLKKKASDRAPAADGSSPASAEPSPEKADRLLRVQAQSLRERAGKHRISGIVGLFLAVLFIGGASAFLALAVQSAGRYGHVDNTATMIVGSLALIGALCGAGGVTQLKRARRAGNELTLIENAQKGDA